MTRLGRIIDGVQFSDELGVPIAEPRLILELKFRGYLPATFKRLIEEFALSPSPASKSRLQHGGNRTRGVGGCRSHPRSRHACLIFSGRLP